MEEKKQKLTIAVDLDEVLGQFLTPLILFHNDTYNTNLHFSQFHSYHFSDVWGGTNDEANQKCHAYFKSKYFADIPVVAGAYEILKKHSNNFNFVVVTSRQLILADITKTWLANHYPNIFSQVLMGNHYGMKGEKRTKKQMCQSINAHALIDDSLGYALETSQVLKHVVLFDLERSYGWNQTADPLPQNVVRLTSWKEIDKFLEHLHKSQTQPAPAPSPAPSPATAPAPATATTTAPATTATTTATTTAIATPISTTT